MDFDQIPIDPLRAFGAWCLVVVAFSLVCLLVALAISMLAAGLKGPGLVAETLFRGARDLATQLPRRVGALATLTFRESVRKKTLFIMGVFILLFMFGHWFLAGQSLESAAKRHVVFVMTAVKWLLIPVAVILSCWGLPADIKERSLHTVVTKPARRSEVVLGRILGYSGVMMLMLLVMSVLGYIWLLRSVPPGARSQLIARVPVYGTMSFISREGVENEIKGINVGDIWEFRSFIEGMTNARAVYIFDASAPEVEQMDDLRLEYNFEAFRTHKGVMGENVRFSFHFVNNSKHYQVKFPRSSIPIQEFAVDPEKRVVIVPRKLDTRNSDIRWLGDYGKSAGPPPKELDLWNDLRENGKLQIRVSCDDGGQYLGMARPDLFFRLPDRPFLVAYVKSMFGLGLMLILLVTLGTTASTFVKGPVATLLLGSFLMIGQVMRGLLEEHLQQTRDTGRPLGGGMLESIYRILTQDNQLSPLPDNVFTRTIQWIDQRIIEWLGAMQNLIPDFRIFDGTPYLANGFDIPWAVRTLPVILTTIGFLIPCLIVGTYSLMMRELEAK